MFVHLIAHLDVSNQDIVLLAGIVDTHQRDRSQLSRKCNYKSSYSSISTISECAQCFLTVCHVHVGITRRIDAVLVDKWEMNRHIVNSANVINSIFDLKTTMA